MDASFGEKETVTVITRKISNQNFFTKCVFFICDALKNNLCLDKYGITSYRLGK